MKNKKLFAILTLVCFMMTLMPVAAFAAEGDVIIADSSSVVYTSDKDLNAQGVAKINLSIRDVKGTVVESTTTAYVWVTKEGSTVPVNTVEILKAAVDADGNETVSTVATVGTKAPYTVTNVTTGKDQFRVQFYSAGKYQVHVSSEPVELDNGRISATSEFTSSGAVVEVQGTDPTVAATSMEITMPNAFDYYKDAKAVVDGKLTNQTGTSYNENAKVTTARLWDGGVATALIIKANNVDEKEVTVQLDRNGANVGEYSPMAGKTVKISTAGAIEVNKESAVTDALGQITFTVSGSAEGTYKVYLTYGQFETVIEVQVGATQANTIECTDSPENPIDILNESLTTGLGKYVEFTMYDVNGNKLKDGVTAGWENAAKSATGRPDYAKDFAGYVAVVSQPTGSKLENKDLWFDGETICSNKAITKEGTYEFKVVLNNGNYATVEFEVKAFTTPVELVLEYPATVELGSEVKAGDLYWLDANKVQKDATGKVNLAATGYAVENFDADGLLIVKGDEKYVGAEITVTAVDERYNLIDTAVIKVANGASELAFATKTAEVKVNNKIRVNVVDEDGNVVALGNKTEENKNVDIKYVILDKPEGAKVFASTTDSDKVFSDGYFTMNLTSNTIGNVTVQAVLKYTATKDTNENTNVTKYYTGTQIFAVGNGSVGDVVVMSVGSNEIVINDAKATIDAAPIVKNDRTFVPFRALAEAFGAEVAYDEATQAVTAELNGVKVVMTIGSATYTVNGAEKTMDVAPFINGSRTMVPVRFVAESFGIKVIPTYDENGATADILFNL